MNVLFFYESMNLGGQQTQTYNLIKRLARQGHRVSWLYLDGEGMQKLVAPFATLERIPVALPPRHYLYRPWKLPAITRRVARFAREHDIDVIISGSGIGSLLSGWAARRVGIAHYRLVGCSLVQVERTLHRNYRWIRIDSLIDGYFGWPAVFEELRMKGVPDRKFIEVDNAVDTDMFHPLPPESRESMRQSLGIAPDELAIGWVGRIAENMQVGNTVELGKRLRELGFHRFKLLLVGGGPWLDGVRQMSERYGLSGQCIFTDWVPMTDVNAYINAMDVVPLLEEDPQGGSIVREAMACGRVALSVDGESGTQRRFMRPHAAILVPPQNFIEAAADAVIRLAADQAAAQRLGNDARTFAVEHMSFEAQARTILDAIQSRSAAALR